ncbi:MAG: amidohydrolase family protein [Bacteroidales bacterium]|nr:amidohydrolase family protein [Bacteroidales bacterium]
MDENFTIAQAVAIKGERIETIGSDSEVFRLSGPNTNRIDLQGKTVLPGLIDAHLHPPGAAISELSEEIPDVHTLREMRQPNLDELNLVAPDHPVFLNGGYGGMVNSCALRNSGIDRNTKHRSGYFKGP